MEHCFKNVAKSKGTGERQFVSAQTDLMVTPHQAETTIVNHATFRVFPLACSQKLGSVLPFFVGSGLA